MFNSERQASRLSTRQIYVPSFFASSASFARLR